MKEDVEQKLFGDPNMANSDKAKVILFPCPYDATACYKKGTKGGPNAILEAAENLELFDDELKRETFKIGIHIKPPLELEALSPEAMVEKIKHETSEIFKAEKVPVVVGGEHSVSIGAVWAASETVKDLTVLHLDAHHDLRDEYEGKKMSHACVARRFLERAPVVQVGMRSLSREEQDFLSSKPANLKSMTVYDIFDAGLWREEVVKHLSENVYISLDLDVLDPAIMPAVGTPEPGGMGWYELLELLRLVAKKRKIVGFDVVELMPIPNLHAPDFLAAKLIYRLLGYIFYKGRS